MFTGLVQDVGVVEGVHAAFDAVRIALRTALAGRFHEGDSVAVNGVCLTVGPPAGERVEAIAIAETLSRTTLGALHRGDRVNLEAALSAGDPMGGHIVQGHVDGTGTLAERRQRGLSWELFFEAPAGVLRYVVEKGSIAIDGVSLTVAQVDVKRFSVAIIPHSWEATVLPERRVGDRVNLEVDILAKYVEKLLGDRVAPVLTEARLRDLGY
ncbi:MAG: riboflavin synthase [Deltaproteobacteria bacterium]|nr:riboflavin synthase [Deltaproteobacteria bacterium]